MPIDGIPRLLLDCSYVVYQWCNWCLQYHCHSLLFQTNKNRTCKSDPLFSGKSRIIESYIKVGIYYLGGSSFK